MSNKRKPRTAPHRQKISRSPLDGVTVLGEPLPLVMGVFERMRIGGVHNGMVEVVAVLPDAEANAIARAMSRAEPYIPGDLRTAAERDGDRFMTVCDRAFEVFRATMTAKHVA